MRLADMVVTAVILVGFFAALALTIIAAVALSRDLRSPRVAASQERAARVALYPRTGAISVAPAREPR